MLPQFILVDLTWIFEAAFHDFYSSSIVLTPAPCDPLVFPLAPFYVVGFDFIVKEVALKLLFP